jgi:hypothetical protein
MRVEECILKQKISLDKSKISKQKISGGGILKSLPQKLIDFYQ